MCFFQVSSRPKGVRDAKWSWTVLSIVVSNESFPVVYIVMFVSSEVAMCMGMRFPWEWDSDGNGNCISMSVGMWTGTSHDVSAGTDGVPNNSHKSQCANYTLCALFTAFRRPVMWAWCVCFLVEYWAVVIMQESFDLLRILFQLIPSVLTLFSRSTLPVLMCTVIFAWMGMEMGGNVSWENENGNGNEVLSWERVGMGMGMTSWEWEWSAVMGTGGNGNGNGNDLLVIGGIGNSKSHSRTPLFWSNPMLFYKI